MRSFDEYTYRHSVNVAVYAVAVAKSMGLSDEELEHIALAGVCHDLGKQKIPSEIINKPGQLSDEEYNEIKSHPQYGYDILKDNGKISRKEAEEKAEKEYIEFNKTQKITSDFDKLLLETQKLENKK